MRVSIEFEAELFAAASALPPQERGRYVRRVCRENQDLADRIARLLADADSAALLLDRMPWRLGIAPAVSQEHNDNEFGPYKLLYELGEGGCGVVFFAQQAAPVRREVALKIIKLGMDTREVISRFGAEQQALARMDHPNIAKVLDAGATPTGRPYFAMELVRGLKIIEYCDLALASVAERLVLFTQVCHAVQHAHHKGIVHRDIKPSNVLVTLHDGGEMVKVIDFGIAKAIRGRLTEQTLHTALNQFLGTPAYMSPEQIDPGLGEVDFRSDIYSLGVVLYELLTGCTPVDARALACKDLRELRTLVRSQLSPSKRLCALTSEQRDAAARRRQTTKEKLIELVAGDLDCIVMRCLETDRERRYSSAAELAAEVQRFLSHEPIVARPPSAIYSVRKFAERHRHLFAATASVVLILAVATIVSAWLAVRAFRAEQLAQTEAKTQQALSSFLRNDLLAQSSPEHEPDRDLKLRTVVDRAAARIRGRFADQPLVEASISTTLAETYESLGEFASAEALFRRALALYRRQLRAADRNTLYVSRRIVGTLIDQGSYVAAEHLAREVLAAHQRFLGTEDKDTLDAMYALASALFLEGERMAGTRLLLQTLEGYRHELGPDDPDTLKMMNELAVFYLTDNKPALAQQLLAQALELRKKVSGLANPSTITVMSNLAAADSDLGQYAEAEPLMAQAVHLRERILGADHPATLSAMNNLATFYSDRGKLEASEQLQAKVLGRGRRSLGAAHPRVLIWMNNLGMTYLEEDKLDAAYEVLKRTLELRQQTLGPEHPETLISLSNLGLVQYRRSQLADAESLLIRAWTASDRVFDADNVRRIVIGERLAAVMLDRREFAAAASILHTVSDARRKKSPDDWRTLATVARLGDALVGLHRYAEAEPLLINAYGALLQRAQTIPDGQKSVLKSTSNSICALYTAWRKPEKRRLWVRERESHE